MTKEERIVVSAYTGYLMCNFEDVHKYIEAIMGRPVWVHELADKEIQNQIMQKAKHDFLGLCEGIE